MKKLIMLLIIGSFIMLNLSCSNMKRHGVPIRVAFWGDPEEIKIITDTIAIWQKDHPGINVILQHTKGGTDYISKILTQIAGGEAPDIVFAEINVFVPMFYKDIFLDLNPFIEKDKDFNITDFFQPIVKRFTRDGKIYCIPRDIAPFAAVFYNKQMFDEAGIAYPKDSWTFNDLLKDAQKLTKRDANGNIVQYGFYSWCWMDFVHGFGGNIVDNVENPTKCVLDSKEALAGLQFYVDLCNKYKVSPTPLALRQSDQGPSQMFIMGKIALFSSGIWESPTFRKSINKSFDWDVVMFPKGPKRRAFGSGGSGYCITKTTKHPQEAWEVLKALAGDYGQIQLAKTGLGQPANRKIAESDAWAKDKINQPLNKGMLNDAVQYIIFEPFNPNWQEAKDKFLNDSIDLLFDKTLTIQQFKTQVVPKINQTLFGKQ